jgi:hypothetical protein
MTTTAKDLLTLARLPKELICGFSPGELTSDKVEAYDRLYTKLMSVNGFIMPLSYGLHERICKALKYFILKSWKASFSDRPIDILKVNILSFNQFLYPDEFTNAKSCDIIYIHNFYDAIEDRRSRQQQRHKNICLKIQDCPDTKFILGMIIEEGDPAYALRDAFSKHWAEFLLSRFTLMSRTH